MRACAIVNPAAGPGDFQRQVNRAVERLQDQGWEVDRRQTSAKGDATRLAREAADQRYDVAIAVGGDGTINEVVNGLVYSDTALAVIPAGTANVYAADVGIPIWGPLRINAVRDAANIIHNGVRRRIDVGRVQFSNGRQRHFFMWCGVGFDAAVTQEVTRQSARRLGVAAWIIAGFMVALKYMGHSGRVVIDGKAERKRMLWAVASNGQLYARLWRISPQAKLDDGLLDLTVFEGYNALSTARHVASVTLGQYARDPSIHVYQGSDISIKTRKPLPVHVDAEPVGTTPVQIKVIPQALSVILPPNLPDHLLVGDDDSESSHKS